MSNSFHSRERGFTLVELSIVLVIIGLLIGAVLKGQELIDSARLKSQQTQMQSYLTATNIFRDRYNALPGDFNLAQSRLGTATSGGFAIADGNANGNIDGNGSTGEAQQFWAHLMASDLVTGLSGTTYTVGAMLPAGKIGGAVNALNQNINGSGTVNWLRLGTPTAAGATTTTLMTAAQIGELDTQFDDGAPGSGDIQTNSTTNCVTAGAYLFANGAVACVGYWRIP